MKGKRAIFLISAVIMTGILCYSVTQALMILIPLQREKNGFKELKQIALSSAQPPAASEQTPALQDESAEQTSQTEESPDQSNRTEDDGKGAADGGWKEGYGLLLEQNSDFAGWLRIEDTDIDYPVMKSAEDDPQYYLNRDFYGNESYSGSLFIGAGCDSSSSSFIVYGHNLNDGSMFGSLDRYNSYDYAQQHPEILFSAPDGERVYRVFAAFQTRVYDQHDDVFRYYEAIGDLGQEEYEEAVSCMRDMSLIHLPDAPVFPQQLLLLSTCSYHTDDGRFVVAAYRIK